METIAKIETAEKQIFHYQQEVAYDTREFTIELLVSKYQIGLDKDDNEIYVPEYQREFVWDGERQSKFIESVILGLPVPFIFVAEMPETGRLEIVDGSQRIRTLAAFLNNNLKLKKLDMLSSLDGYYFKDLSVPRQRKFKNSVIRMVVLSDKTTETVRTELFKRINRGSDVLNNMEVRKGLLKGEFRDFIYNDCAKISLFTDLYPMTKLTKDRQEGQEIILRFFAFTDEYPNYSKGLGKFLDKYLEGKNKNFSEKERQEKLSIFENMLRFVHKYFPKGFVKPNSKVNVASKIYFESIAVGTALAIKEKPQLIDENIDLTWLNSTNFKKVIEPIFNTHSPKGIKSRIDFVKNSLLGKEIDVDILQLDENED